MSGDGSINGQFIIKKGQGLSQAIRDELGLTQDEANKLGSVWTKIFEQVDKQQNENIKNNKGKIYTGGNDLNGNSKSNYVVGINQAISFSKEIWNEIVRLVNEKLGKNIVSAEQDENFEATGAQNTNAGQGSGQAQGAGQVKGGTSPTNLSEQAVADAKSVKVTVTNEAKTFYEEERAHAKDLAKNLKEVLTAKGMVNMTKALELLKRISPDTVAYVLEAYPELATDIDEVFRMGAGFDKDEVYRYVLKPLLERANTLGKTYNLNGGPKITVENAKDLSLEDMKKLLNYIGPDVIAKTDERIAAKDAELPQIQQTFDEANNFLAEVANMEPKPEIKDHHQDGMDDGKICKFPDGRYIIAIFDDKGEIKEIYINSNTTKNDSGRDCNEIAYVKGNAYYDIDQNKEGYGGKITSGYDFEKLKALAEKIFGKPNSEE